MQQLVNGKAQPIEEHVLSTQDRGFSLGHGLFETIRVYQGHAPLLYWHWQRLQQGANALKITLPFDFKQLLADIQTLLSINHLNSAQTAVRLTISAGPAARGILSEGLKTTVILQANVLKQTTFSAMQVASVETRRMAGALSASVKSISYLDNILAAQEARAKGADEAIIFNQYDRLAEGAISTIFLIQDNKIYTPPISEGALPGITRRVLLEALDCNIVTQTINRQQLQATESAFACNALWGLREIALLDNKKLDSKPRVLAQIAEQYRCLIDKLVKKQTYLGKD